MGTSGEGRKYLHVAVSDALRARIVTRELAPGAILPSEHDLTAEFGVSRSVVRQALRTLADEGHVQAAPGRGTVVTTHREWHRDAQLTAGLSAQMRALGTRVSTEVLTYAVRRPPSGPAAQAYGDSGEALFLERLRRLDDEPVAFIRTWLPAWVADTVSQADLEDASLHAQLHDRAGVSLHGGRRQIRAVSAAGDLAARLAVPEDSAVLLLEGESLDQSGSPVEVFATWHRSDRIALDITEVAPPGAEPAAVGAAAANGSAAPVAATGADDELRLAEDAVMETLRRIRAARGKG